MNTMSKINLKNIKAVIFDMDGVITNTMPYHYQAWNIAIKKEIYPAIQNTSPIHGNGVSTFKITSYINHVNSPKNHRKKPLAR